MFERVVARLAEAEPGKWVLKGGMADGDGHVTWRSSVAAGLAGKPFGGIKLDVSLRAHELDQTDVVTLPNALAFADIGVPAVEVIDVNRHAAEKFHAMLRDFGDRENTRVRDLVDLVILVEHELLDQDVLRATVRRVWHERGAALPPAALPALPRAGPAGTSASLPTMT